MDKIENMTRNLMAQVHKIVTNTNSNAIKTHYRYEAATERFCKFLVEKYHVQKFTNVKGKHFEAYANHMAASGKAGSYIGTELSAVRWVHGRSGSVNVLPTNETMREHGVNIPDREVGVTDRSWTEKEIQTAIDIANSMGRQDVSETIEFTRAFGMRLEEVCKMRLSDVTKAIQDNELYVKGKGGKERCIPILCERQRDALESAVRFAKENNRTHMSDRVFSPSEKGGVKFEENFRSAGTEAFAEQQKFCEEAGFKLRTENITWHGLRHSFAQKKYNIG